MGGIDYHKLTIFASILLIVLVLIISVGIILEKPEETDVQKTACFKASSSGECEELNTNLGNGTRKLCCQYYDKCC